MKSGGAKKISKRKDDHWSALFEMRDRVPDHQEHCAHRKGSTPVQYGFRGQALESMRRGGWRDLVRGSMRWVVGNVRPSPAEYGSSLWLGALVLVSK